MRIPGIRVQKSNWIFLFSFTILFSLIFPKSMPQFNVLGQEREWPEPIGSWPNPALLGEVVCLKEVNGNLVALVNAGGLTVFKIGFDGGFSVIDTLPIGQSDSFSIRDDFAYYGDVWEGFVIVDISNPENLRLVGKCQIDYPFHEGIGLVNHFVYVSSCESGLTVIDIENPEKPTVLRCLSLPGCAVNISIKGIFGYVALMDGGLGVVDLSTPDSPVEIANVPNIGHVNDLVIHGDYAYLASGENGLQIVDIKDPRKPQVISKNQGAPFSLCIAIRYPLVYLGGGDGVTIYDVNNPFAPIVKSKTLRLKAVRSLHVTNERIYLATNNGEVLHVYNLETPYNPVLVGKYFTWVDIRDIAIFKKTCYLYGPSSVVHIIDIQEPSLPSLLESVDVGTPPRKIVGNDKYGFLWIGDNSVSVFKIEGGRFRKICEKTFVAPLLDILVSEDFLIAVNRYGIVDFLKIREGESLEVVKSLQIDQGIGAVGYHEGNLYFSSQGYFNVIGIPDFGGEADCAKRPIDGMAEFILFFNKYAIATVGERECLEIFDISNPGNPIWVSRYFPSYKPNGVAALDSKFLVVSTDFGEEVIDLVDPRMPSRALFNLNSVSLANVATHDGYIYSAKKNDGVFIYKFDQ